MLLARRLGARAGGRRRPLVDRAHGDALVVSLAAAKLAARAAQRVAPDLPRALLLDKLWAGWPDVARESGVVAIVGNWRVLDAGVFELARAAGWRVLSYTVNDPAEAERLQGLGIAGLITDAIDRLGPGGGR